MPQQSFMEIALEEARAAGEAGEVPVGCVIVRDGTVIARAHNRTPTDCDPTAHCEMLAMCAAAISFARIRRLYYGAPDPKGGAVDNGVRFFNAGTCHHRPETYGGIAEGEAAALLRDFFRERR